MLGGTYALLGIGLTLIFGIMRVVNFTHGELYAFGAYMMYAVVMRLGVDFFVALPLAVALGMLLGAALELVLLRPLRSSDIDITMLVMIGAWIVLQNSEQLAWTGVAQSIASPFPAIHPWCTKVRGARCTHCESSTAPGVRRALSNVVAARSSSIGAPVGKSKRRRDTASAVGTCRRLLPVAWRFSC